MNKIIFILVLSLTFLVYKFFKGDSSYPSYVNLQEEILKLQEENSRLEENIDIIKAKIKNLKEGKNVIEEKARNELGLTKEKETFYQIIK
tara:strand:+ start:437 stop:706 length:270 start_codon:yes stop_codon:yes gene_type:complete